MLLFLLNSKVTYGAQVDVLNINPGRGQILVLDLNSDDRVKGSLAVSGGSGNDINFWVTDPDGTTILGLGRVNRGADFNFQASESGGYTLHFDNSFSIVSTKTVTLSYDIDRTIIPGISQEASIIVIIVIVAMAILVARKVRKPTIKSSSRSKIRKKG